MIGDWALRIGNGSSRCLGGGGDWGVGNLGDRPSMMIFVGTHLTEFEVKLVFGHLIPL